jgi:amino acid transporter
VTIVALLALVSSLLLSARKTNLVDAFGYFGTLASFGFLVVYMLVSIGTPFYLKRIGALRPRHLIVSAASVVLILIAIEGSLVPVPDWPTWIIPYLFVLIVAPGVLYFAYLKWRDPSRLQAIEADLLDGPAGE